MRLNLAEIRPGKTSKRHVSIEGARLETAGGAAEVRDIDADLRFGLDPLGYTVHYRVSARAEASCVATGKPVTFDIAVDDWLSLRTRHPEGSHVVLDDAEMNVRFITSDTLDLEAFVLEIVELEIPAYPRHPDADRMAAETQAAGDEEADMDSPFSALARMLKE